MILLFSSTTPLKLNSLACYLTVEWYICALSFTIGISAEYVGRVAVANGKETAALAIQATAESEVLLAQAERIKAVLPLCVGKKMYLWITTVKLSRLFACLYIIQLKYFLRLFYPYIEYNNQCRIQFYHGIKFLSTNQNI